MANYQKDGVQRLGSSSNLRRKENAHGAGRSTAAKAMLERERDNRLLDAQAITVAIAHEIRQPLTAMATNAVAALRWLGQLHNKCCMDIVTATC